MHTDQLTGLQQAQCNAMHNATLHLDVEEVFLVMGDVFRADGLLGAMTAVHLVFPPCSCFELIADPRA